MQRQPGVHVLAHVHAIGSISIKTMVKSRHVKYPHKLAMKGFV